MDKLPVGLQVYGLRGELQETPDRFPALMQQVKAMGYDGVELAGLYGLSAQHVRDALADCGLVPVSAHVPLAEMTADAEKVAEDYTLIGCRYIAVPYLPEEYRPLTDGYAGVLEEIARISEVMKGYGITLLYHNHDFEFVRMPDGSYGLDDIYAKIGPDSLQAEPDTCWIKVAGADPVAWIKSYAGRVPVVHLKDFIRIGSPKNLYELIGIESEEVKDTDSVFEFRPVGFGQQLWEPILGASIEAGAKWVIVEQDQHYAISALEAARRSREYLKILGW